MIKEIKIGGDLNPTPEDKRDCRLGAVFTLPRLSDLPEAFLLEPLRVKNQLDSDFCSGFATCGMRELQEGVELSPEFSFALSKLISGDPMTWGQDQRTAMKVHQKYGAILRALAGEFGVETRGAIFLRDISNWPDRDKFIEAAKEHLAESYFEVTGPYDHFDNIRAAIWKFRNEKRAASFGTIWGWSAYEAVIPDKFPTSGGGHMTYFIGWKKINSEAYLVLQNSYGPEVGDGGRFYLPRGVVNEMVARYKSFMFVDMPPQDAKFLNEKNGAWWAKLWVAIKRYLRFFIN